MANATQNPQERLFTAVREAQDRQLRLDDPGEHARARARLLQAVDRAQSEARPAAPAARPRAPWRRWGLGTLAAAACAFAVPVGWPDPRTLEFQIDGVELDSQELIVAEGHSRIVDVSDTTRIELAPGGRMYVDGIRDNGATVVLERGSVALGVHHEDDTSWAVEAGPYAVHVTGTEFQVEWEPGSERFAVAVSEGSVRVEGPEGLLDNLGAGDSLVRERGKATIEPETLEADPHAGDTGERVAQAGTTEPAGEDPSGAAEPQARDSEAEAEGTANQPKSQANEPKPVEAGPSWADYFADADYAGAWGALEELPGGIHGEAKRASAATLLDLADVARFTRHRGDARQLLEQLRDGHPSSKQAGVAAFTLGRLSADGGDYDEATVWFELYLDEVPNGSLARDALGRLMDSYEKLGRGAKATATAKRYLARFPSGPHVEKAQELIGE